MLLAELEVYHSRPITPTRRISLGHLVLPVDPLPGFGGVLLGAVIVRHLGSLDEDLHPDLHRLISEIDRGDRVVQPRIRHRYQVDQHGLARSRHRLVGEGEQIGFEFDDSGAPVPQLLGAVYAAERLGEAARHGVCRVLQRAMRWNGVVGPALISHLTGVGESLGSSFVAFADPLAWALDVMGFPPGTARPGRRDVTRQFRLRLMEVHPDHGGDERDASRQIAELGEARRILSEDVGRRGGGDRDAR
jgi:hypothetical protein